MPATVSTAAHTAAAMERFNHAFSRHDVNEVMASMTVDCVFENTRPAPDGRRFVGQAAVRESFETFFAKSPRARFEIEEVFVSGDRCVLRWTYHWARDEPGRAGHVRGVDIMRVRGGKVAEKLSYVKG